MENEDKILFWFRENLLLEGNFSLYNAVNSSSEIIPVFCFDPREEQLMAGSGISNGFLQEQINSVATLRNQLQIRGSNLLVVIQPCETIIPSLARVLKVSKVITNQLVEPEKSTIPELTAFRNQKAREISRLLHMHSIPVVFGGSAPPTNFLPASFPRFPEINPGMIPSAR